MWVHTPKIESKSSKWKDFKGRNNDYDNDDMDVEDYDDAEDHVKLVIFFTNKGYLAHSKDNGVIIFAFMVFYDTHTNRLHEH